MVLFRGVCVALQAMHNYRVPSGGAGKKAKSKARRVREEGARADREAADEADEAEEPLMEDEATLAQEGVAAGDTRAYAHRDIKPGMHFTSPQTPSHH